MKIKKSALDMPKPPILRGFLVIHLFCIDNMAGAEGLEPSARGFGEIVETPKPLI